MRIKDMDRNPDGSLVMKLSGTADEIETCDPPEMFLTVTAEFWQTGAFIDDGTQVDIESSDGFTFIGHVEDSLDLSEPGNGELWLVLD